MIFRPVSIVFKKMPTIFTISVFNSQSIDHFYDILSIFTPVSMNFSRLRDHFYDHLENFYEYFQLSDEIWTTYSFLDFWLN